MTVILISFIITPPAKPAPTGGENAETVPGSGQDLVLGAQVQVAAVLVNKDVLTPLSRLAALQPVRRKHPALGEDGHVQRFEEFHFADQAVPTAVPAIAAGMLADGELF